MQTTTFGMFLPRNRTRPSTRNRWPFAHSIVDHLPLKIVTPSVEHGSSDDHAIGRRVGSCSSLTDSATLHTLRVRQITFDFPILGDCPIGTTVEELLLGAAAIERLTQNDNGRAAARPQGEATTIIKPSVQKNRMDELREFLLREGPMFRKTILAKSGIPQGTVNTKLNTKNFKQLADGRWTGEKPDE